MNICIFPGTFNPIHKAHLMMAEFTLEKYKFDKIIFIPSYLPPHKSIQKDLARHRLNMVKLAISNNPHFIISDIEYQSEGKSYSLITVKKILEEYDIKGKLNFIIGTDAFANIKTWYKADELKELVHFIVFPRGTDRINPKDYKDYSYEIAEMNKIDISSTELRCSHKFDKTDKEVKEYISKNELYN